MPVETPASLSFGVMDIAVISKRVRERGDKLILKNTWGPSIFAPFNHGYDLSVNASKKYIGGHYDLLLCIVSGKKEDEDIYHMINKSVANLGCPPGPDDAYLALRDLRTLSVRMGQHGKSYLQFSSWLEDLLSVIRLCTRDWKTIRKTSFLRRCRGLQRNVRLSNTGMLLKTRRRIHVGRYKIPYYSRFPKPNNGQTVPVTFY